MSKQALLVVVIVVVLIMVVPALLADGIEQFFRGIGVMIGRWSD